MACSIRRCNSWSRCTLHDYTVLFTTDDVVPTGASPWKDRDMSTGVYCGVLVSWCKNYRSNEYWAVLQRLLLILNLFFFLRVFIKKKMATMRWHHTMSCFFTAPHELHQQIEHSMKTDIIICWNCNRSPTTFGGYVTTFTFKGLNLPQPGDCAAEKSYSMIVIMKSSISVSDASSLQVILQVVWTILWTVIWCPGSQPSAAANRRHQRRAWSTCDDWSVSVSQCWWEICGDVDNRQWHYCDCLHSLNEAPNEAFIVQFRVGF